MKLKVVNNYLEVLKPRPSILLTFIGTVAAIIAGEGHPPLDKLLLTLPAILLLSAGANGLTNYLDRNIDARMQRTKNRALPSKRIYPPEKALALIIGLIIISLILAWQLHPLSFLSGVIGVIAASVWRKRSTCVFPQGALASCTPALIGWFAIKPTFSWELVLLCALIAVWLPIHVWSVMIANREDYISAGLTFFPMSRKVREAVKVLVVFSMVLGVTSLAIYFVGDFTTFYLVTASLLSILILSASARLVVSGTSNNAWKLYKLSAFPYLGLIFVAMFLDVWIM